MYRVLIVDDEPEIRCGIRLKVDWESLQLTVAGEVSNGLEAMDLLAEEAIDIVMTDMNMPVMNGISFMEACQEQYPLIKIIVITGYEDFHYARAAVRTKARDYLLKPVSEDELTAALSKVKKELDEERNSRDRQQTDRWRLSLYYKEMKEHFIVQLVKEEWERENNVRDRAKLFDLDEWDGRRSVRFITAGLKRSAVPSDEERTPDKLRLPFEMICMEYAEASTARPQVFRDPNYPGLLHFILANDEAVLMAFNGELHPIITSHLGYEPAFGIGDPVSGFGQWKEGYISALLAWNLLASDIRHMTGDPLDGVTVLTEEAARAIRRCLVRGELESFDQLVHKELSEALAISQVHFVKRIFHLYLLLDSIAQSSGMAFEIRDPLWIRPNLVWSFDTVDKAEEYLLRLGKKIHDQTVKPPAVAEHTLLAAAKQFIDDNYMYDLTLTMLAERFNYNASYFSELFKAKAGKTFIQYVTDVRMSQALHLLEKTALSLWDIAELTGFSNASYFSSKFKRVYGVTPSEYRQRAT